MPVAVSTITQSGQISIPKSIREILGVAPHDQVALLSDGHRVELVAVPKDPLALGSREEFLERVARAEEDYSEGRVKPVDSVVADIKAAYEL
jgi:AbrB family looped-hinge helix DNA binding protein